MKTKPSWGGFRPGAGRPRAKGPRCRCGKNTLKRAKMRNFDCCKKAGVLAV
jgi:hypothetical protein